MQTTENYSESAHGVQSGDDGKEKPAKIRSDKELASFGMAVLLNLVALGLSLLFPAISRPYYFFIGATAFVAWRSGWRPGTFSGILSAVLAAMFVLLPSTQILGNMSWGSYAGFLAMMVLVFALAAVLRHKELELDELYLHFAGVVQISEDAIITVDHEQNITMFNAGAEMIFGYTAADILGKSINLLLPEKYREMHSAHLRAFAKSPDVLRPMSRRGSNIYGQRSDGSHFPAEASISKFDAAGKQILTVRLRDISERVVAEHKLRQLASIVESSHDAIISVDLDGVLRSWNQGAEDMYVYTAAEVIGKPEGILLPPDCEDEQLLNLQRMSKGVKTNYETFRMRKDGTQIDVALTVSPIRDKHGVVVGASCIARDITERLRLEQLLHRSQKMEAVGLLAGGVAHDFNNLLGIIIGHAYLMQSSDSESEPVRKAGEEIINACEKANALTRQLLAFGRKQIMNLKILDLNEITGGLGKMIPRLLGEDIEVRIDLKLLKADPSQL
jgi:PAS domain S-box-containing protein